MDPTLFLCSTFLISKAYASPMLTSASLSPKSINQTDFERSWVADPVGRGTLDIMFSCITTLFLCSYTAFHPNTPPFGGPRALWKRLKYMGFTIVFPGYILYYALKQLRAANRLRNQINQYHQNAMLEDQQTPQDAVGSVISPERGIKIGRLIPWSRQRKSLKGWNLEQAYFAACGGVAVDSSDFCHEARLQFTSAGISMLIRCGLPPEVPLEHVRASSNADILSKGGTCLQSLWFVIQSCARLQSGLPLTLLETHILIHVGCTLLTYLVWLRKPYAVSSPMLCSDRRIRDMAALFLLKYDPALYVGDNQLDVENIESCDASHDEIAEISVWHPEKAATSRRTSAAQLEAANRAIGYLPSEAPSFKWKKCTDGTIFINEGRQLVAREIPNMDDLGIKDLRLGSPKHWGERRPDNDLWHFIALQVLSAAYGLCYLAVWRSHFPSAIEMWLWRMACLSQFAFFLAGLSGRLLRQVPNYIQHRFQGYHENSESRVSRLLALWGRILRYKISRNAVWFIQISVTALMAIASVTTVLARLYLFTESWISLRSPPQGTYATVHWTAYIPHVS